ncbi:sugar ABC transporter substrate-binding protein [Actinoplanes sp. NPDC051859]|uniref:sugar ABC transporter substrate-binding protein n=1 Tax=Actinoplanes sp. NPDC051859 TaxID=3363909 RepID=UPI00378C03AC
MRRKLSVIATLGLLAVAGVAGCSTAEGDKGSDGATKAPGSGKVGVILPDTTTSQRWGTDDPKLLKAAFDKAGVPVDIRNAQGDKAQFQRIADEMIDGGVTVLMTVSLDAPTGKAVLDKARAEGIKTIDYDRMTLDGGADYYVSFDNEAVGRLQAEGLTRCLAERKAKTPTVAALHGAPTDHNATQFREGAEKVFQSKFDSGEFIKGPGQPVDDWNNRTGEMIFREMWFQTGREIQGVLAANDGLANSAISVLRQDGMNGKVPVTGQDATVQGLQNVLAGDQCMTVYKSIKKEAGAAAELAIQLYNGKKPELGGTSVKDPESGAYIPAVLEKPVAIFAGDVETVIADGFVEKSAVCTGQFAPLCKKNGIK